VGKLGNVTTAAADINQITIVLVHAGDDELGTDLFLCECRHIASAGLRGKIEAALRFRRKLALG